MMHNVCTKHCLEEDEEEEEILGTVDEPLNVRKI